MLFSEMKQFLSVKKPDDVILNFTANFTDDPHYKARADVPEEWNWTMQGAVTSVKDQGSCGSCWTFSVAGNVEGQWWKKNNQLIDFSMQQLIDCDKSNFGCSGGWPYNAIDWMAKNGGMETLSDYPLRKNYSGPCEFDESKSKAKIQGYLNITHDESIIRDALY